MISAMFSRLVRSSWSLAASLALGAAAWLPVQAQVTVTSVNYGTLVNATDTTSGGITYSNQFRPVQSVGTSLGDYNFAGPLASNVFIRRNTDSSGDGRPNRASDNPNNTTLIYQSTAANQSLGDYETTLSNVFLGSNLYTGVRNPFGNGAGISTNSNIERIDFHFASGYTVQADDALVFFDVENTGNFGDGFRIAAYTGVGTVNGVANAPTTYANTGLLIAPDSFGGPINNPDGGASATYRRSTFTAGDSLTGTATDNVSAGTLQLVGILIRFSDLGLTVGQTIFGYSLMAGDVAPGSNAANLVNWNNASVFLTDTDPAGYGNMDFMGFGAQVSRPVPEPSTYGAIFLVVAVSGLALHRRRRTAASLPPAPLK
jgi:hypothetical protein